MENLTESQKRTIEVVKRHSKERPVTGTEIANQIGLKERDSGKQGADMRSVINALRVKGYPICAHGNGYYWPRDQKELTEYVDSFQGRIDDQQRACDGLRAGSDKLAEVPKQEQMFMYRSSKDGIMYHVVESKLEKFLSDHPGSTKITP